MVMPSFSSLIDVSSFFIGILINLLLVALICYYFKKKFDVIEVAQSEQAKILHGLIQEKMEENARLAPPQTSGLNFFTMADLEKMDNNIVEETDINEHADDIKRITTNEPTLNLSEAESESEGGNDSDDEMDENDSESDSDSDDEDVDTEDKPFADDVLVKSVQMVIESSNNELMENSVSYDKLTVKELKELLNQRDISFKKSTKKQEMIDLLNKYDNDSNLNIVLSNEIDNNKEEQVTENMTNDDNEVEVNTENDEEGVNNQEVVDETQSTDVDIQLGEDVLIDDLNLNISGEIKLE